MIDANEEENCYVTFDDKNTKKHTHMEIFPSAILGAGASIIPYPEHNQSPRNTYESAMAKQSLGFSTPMMNTSTYVRQHFMLYPQTPIVSKSNEFTWIGRKTSRSKLCSCSSYHLMVTTLKMQLF